MGKIKVIVNGAKGKMGLEAVRAVQNEADLELVAQTDIGDDLAKVINQSGAEVVVDFTHPSAVMENIRRILESGAHGVIGTTGISENDQKEIQALCEKHKVNCLVAPNFAIGAVLMMLFAKEAIKHMPKAEIIEFHHEQKADKPSGTAIKTGHIMGKEVPIHSVRLPGLVAHQEVIFGGLGQTLTIRHDSLSRESFMPGVVMAVRKIKGLKGLVYGLENLL
ncbi:4-hydroxy-tetrahydrodipicolinate reductase [candidate division WOR-1 bacterium RIFOXYA12_FULL_52_29]|uniref:4-hydroxy-tetrahydrodipicolinate reductase n=1 Tax=candidate division WOR-1 bacterium RIFOXYC12_FULL_54_18 TaxID=1802584 RepID=A0A1F4T867_UNCSA|nr:MAG: 4-hydroxy-tetrahydrodipicolinate reductase [candidate division WOR-1 bacterium RIFOXYA2_FULL_51_19]OGC17856.1 MAG: 4-hydroxy-tetrahydrodipicolinate reductase [candidate division WOR-1 bacterium RIFOXYA12_FULL_52_29]OGC26713.1 MAG: 4-hydroxy-tetrahydrodipicolinate reductase [candidate division WOR-1 bacterium RIFOXYB2_FULL_45_9]OGC28273.1 MAG: 4-hydroxy-tetrahydrodipicolinate reductase [candidate division WOR-1 bacterium RIFOXYC12_FULL_54_18]OGC31269.1 MAG: 4-hydroxy-tetrahydrodipicolina